jgi:ABC-type nitrate/sulfonate/bicarbonate transport system substrate-binding protein
MPQVRFMCLWASVITLVIALTQTSQGDAAAPLEKVVFVFSGFNERTSFIFVAKDRHFFEEQGLETQIVQVRNGPVAVSAMAANEAQFYTTSANRLDARLDGRRS